MTRLRVWLSRALDCLVRRGRDQRLSDEIGAHLRFLTDEYVARGLMPEDARLAARRAFGGIDQMKAVYRDQRGLPSLDSFIQDVRFAVRLLVRDRWFTAATVSVLALGIGVNTTVFTILNAMNLRTLPVDRADQIMALRSEDVTRGRQSAVSFPDFRDWQARSHAFSGLAAYAPAVMNVGDTNRSTDRFGGAYVTANAFDILRERPVLGRNFWLDDDRPGAPAVALLSHGVWVDRYGGNPSIVGAAIRVNGVPATVIGVMPPGFRFPTTEDVWLPLSLAPGFAVDKRNARTLAVFGRLADDATIADARAELLTISGALGAAYPDTNQNLRGSVVPFHEQFGRITDFVPLALMTAAAFVLFIACANASNLLLARSIQRGREISLRVALGASRGRIVGQLLAESVLLASVAGVVAWGLAVALVRLFATQTEGLSLPYWMVFTFDMRVFAFVAAICLVTAILFGLAPAWHLSNTEAAKVLKDRSSAGSARARRWTGTLLVAELTLTIVLLGGAGLLIRSSIAMYASDVVDGENLLTARLSLTPTKYATTDQRAAFYRELEQRLARIPAIASATVTTHLPFTGGTRRLVALGSKDDDSRLPEVRTIGIGSRYFETLGLSLLRGRTIAIQDGSDTTTVVVNTRFIELYLRGRDPIGQRIRLLDVATAAPALEGTIVGVAPTIRHSPMLDREPIVYISLNAQPLVNSALIVRGRAGSAGLATVLRAEVLALDPDLPLFNAMLLSKVSSMSRFTYRVGTSMFTLFAAIAMWLSAMGLYAVTSYGVSQRTREIGVRVALGAQQSQVLRLFLRDVFAHLTLGLALGLAGAFAVGRVLQGLLVQTSGADPVTFAAVALVVCGVVVLATIVPARRALRIDPVVALRHE